MKSKLFIAALVSVSIFAVAASAYGYRTRQIAIAGWADAERLSTDLKSVKNHADRLVSELKTAHEFSRLVILRDAGLPIHGTLDNRAINAAIRDYVYRTNIVVGSTNFDFKDRGQHYAILGADDASQMCGGMSEALQFALKRVGIPARTVQLAGQKFLAGDDRFETHVTVEVYIDGKWQISDPTFNMSVNCSIGGKELSVSEVASCVKRGGKLVGIPGRTQIAGRTIADYYAPYETFFDAYAREPVNDGLVSEKGDEQPFSGWIGETLKLYDK